MKTRKLLKISPNVGLRMRRGVAIFLVLSVVYLCMGWLTYDEGSGGLNSPTENPLLECVGLNSPHCAIEPIAGILILVGKEKTG